MRRVILIVVAAAIVGGMAGAARAHGDPASDVLFLRDVFVPSPSPPKSTVAALKRNVAAAYAKGYRIKVAVIATRSDLGPLQNLFNRPNAYAKYLGQELSPVFVGPLLIVMPAGFGVYDGGRSTRQERRVLDSMARGALTAEGLTRSAVVAVRRLTSAGALRSKDIRAPHVVPRPATGRRGTTVRLEYAVFDDSERTKDVVRISTRGASMVVLRTGPRRASYGHLHGVMWRIPSSLKVRALRYCVVATDPSGNRNAPACATLRVR